MANDYKPLNRNQTWTVAQKAAIKKVFVRGAIAAAAGNHTGFTRTDVHQIVNPYLDANEGDDIGRLCQAIREAITAAGTATITIDPAGAENSIIYDGKADGAAYNDVTVAYIDPAGNNQLLVVTVIGDLSKDINVSLATGAGGAITSTAALIKAAVEALPAAAALVDLSYGVDGGVGDGSGVVAAVSATNLAGGGGIGYDPIQHITAFRMTSTKKKIIKNLANSTIALIV